MQMGLKRILEAIYEVDFLPVSYGFRLGRNCHQAVDALYETVMVKPTNYIVDTGNIWTENLRGKESHNTLWEISV